MVMVVGIDEIRRSSNNFKNSLSRNNTDFPKQMTSKGRFFWCQSQSNGSLRIVVVCLLICHIGLLGAKRHLTLCAVPRLINKERMKTDIKNNRHENSETHIDLVSCGMHTSCFLHAPGTSIFKAVTTSSPFAILHVLWRKASTRRWSKAKIGMSILFL